MLAAQVERYLLLRQTLGFKLRELAGSLRAFVTFAANKNEMHICAAAAVDWATEAPSPQARYVRLRSIGLLARFLRAEDLAHEVPHNPFHASTRRRLPYIYAPEEIAIGWSGHSTSQSRTRFFARFTGRCSD